MTTILLFAGLGLAAAFLSGPRDSFVEWLLRAWTYMAFAWLIVQIAQAQP